MNNNSNPALPLGWVRSTIGEVTLERVDQLGPNGSAEFLYVDISSIDTKTKKICEPKTLRPAQAPSRARQRLKSMDVVVSMTRPNLNAVAIVPTEMEGAIGSTGFDVLRTQQIEPAWLFYLVQSSSFVESMSSLVQGALYPAVRPKDIRAYQIPLAPLAEQRRIVAELEKQLTRLDAAVAALKRLQANLKRYRASVFNAACEGRLVPTEAELARRERRSYEPASLLLGSILAERRIQWKVAQQKRSAKASRGHNWQPKYEEPVCNNQPGPRPLPEGWAWVSLDSMLREPLRNGHSAKSVDGASGVPTFTLSAVTYGDFSPANVKNTSADPRKVEDLWVEPGDIFIERSNTPELVGTARLFSGQARMAIFPDLLIRIRVVNCVLPSYVELALQSSPSREFFRRSAQGISGTMPKIDQGIVQQVMIPLPPFAEQERITNTVEDRFSVIKHLEAELEAQMKKAESLRQSILKCAFQGKLVPQDPNEEPANILLERIRGTASHSGTAIPGCAPPSPKKPSRKLAHYKRPVQVLSR